MLVLMRFGVDFWKATLKEMGYTIIEERLDLETLVKNGIFDCEQVAKTIASMKRVEKN